MQATRVKKMQIHVEQNFKPSPQQAVCPLIPQRIHTRKGTNIRGLEANNWPNDSDFHACGLGISKCFSGNIWCPGEDSNLHGLHHWYLKPARLPIPPPGPGGLSIGADQCCQSEAGGKNDKIEEIPPCHPNPIHGLPNKRRFDPDPTSFLIPVLRKTLYRSGAIDYDREEAVCGIVLCRTTAIPTVELRQGDGL